MSRYPNAAKYIQWIGSAVYNGNQPKVVVIHVGQGYIRTWDAWAAAGFNGASFHYGVPLQGKPHQYLEHHQGGAHAGIVRNPTAKLINELLPFPNLRSIGVEHEGFSSGRTPEGVDVGQWNDGQIAESAALVRWICEVEGIPKDRDHIIGHYEIDAVNRPNDPGPLFPWKRFMQLITEEEMTPEEIEALVNARIDAVFPAYYRKLTGQYWDRAAEGAFTAPADPGVIKGISEAIGFADHAAHPGGDTTAAKLADHIANHSSGVGIVPDHEHVPGRVKRP